MWFAFEGVSAGYIVTRSQFIDKSFVIEILLTKL